MSQITKQMALNIVKKLGATATARPKKRHEWVEVRHEGRVVAMFGIRRGSGKDIPHDHIPSQLYLRPRQARLLGECPMTREAWLRIMAEKGMLRKEA
jgi:hypothetical protein